VPRIVVACEDAGGARAIAPVARALATRGDLVTTWLGAKALEAFRDEGLGQSASASLDSVRDCDLLLTASTCWGERLEAQAISLATASAVPSVTVVDFWSNYAARLSYPTAAQLEVLPTRLAVIDDGMKTDLEAVGVPGARMVVTGSPAFDRWLNDPLPRRRSDGLHILFISQPIATLHGDSLGYTETTVLAALAPVASRLGARVVVRPHPREDADALEAIVRALPCDARMDDSATLREALAESSVVVGLTSVALIEAALAGRPVVSAQLGRRGPDGLPTNRSGLTAPATDVESLERALAAADSASAHRAAAFAPGATERVVELIDAVRTG
jgi:hypothetical protein